MTSDKDAPSEGETGHAREKWIVYLSKDRRVLLAEAEGPDGPLPDDLLQSDIASPGATCPLRLTEWNHLLDLAFDTRMPQYGTKELIVGGEKRFYTLKVFPDLAQDGELKGLIQVVERSAPDAVWQTDVKRTVNAVLDLTLSGVVLYSPPRDRVLNANRRFSQMSGYTLFDLQDMPGINLLLLLHLRSRSLQERERHPRPSGRR